MVCKALDGKLCIKQNPILHLCNRRLVVASASHAETGDTSCRLRSMHRNKCTR